MPKDLFQHEDNTECRKIKSRGHYCHNFSRLGGTYCSCGRILPSTGRAVKLPGTLSLRCSTSSRLLSTGYQDPPRAEVVANPIHQDNIIKLTHRKRANQCKFTNCRDRYRRSAECRASCQEQGFTQQHVATECDGMCCFLPALQKMGNKHLFPGATEFWRSRQGSDQRPP